MLHILILSRYSFNLVLLILIVMVAFDNLY